MAKSNSKTKTEIIKIVAQKSDVTIALATNIIDLFFEEIKVEVANGGKINIPKFGIFETIIREARTGRNPQTGESIVISASKAPKFKASSEFKKHTNQQTETLVS
ncbi:MULTISPECIES: HU family DNA-binding protein [Spiroplasma]|uniref:DNA-binding protein n=1 Tax=Spiroplasma ixodetis TaxID=2141 RepID=A0ABM8BU60_9MOLU|nr:HU family DNA-binding protein [Spiroplasma ixodetis]BDT03383.1 DNA-binding protein [Spiroplasma ixodetis]